MKKGFTLAEVVITLGIIGVVAAMTIPGLINNYQKRMIETSLKETYSILQQTMKFTEYDDVALVDFPDSPNGVKDWFKTYLEPHMKYGRVCFHTEGCWQNKGKLKNLNGSLVLGDYGATGIGNNNMTITLTNGSNINFVGLSSAEAKNNYQIEEDGYISIIIDANGNRGPNTFGKDIFSALYHESKGIIAAGDNLTVEAVNNNCKSNSTGLFCLSRVKNNGWEIPTDVWKTKVK